MEDEIDLFEHLLADTHRIEFRPKLVQERLIRLPAYEDRLKELPDTFNDEQCKFAQQYWNGLCCVCQQAATGYDHWIPVSSMLCPGTIALNMIPMCIHCNDIKGDRDEEWLVYEFGQWLVDAAHSYFGLVADVFDL